MTSTHRARRARGGALAALLAIPVLAPRAARAAEPIDKAACAETYRSAQVQRKDGALKSARESLLVCASDRCPSVMQPDCTRWLTEVEAALPSVTFAAKGVDGGDVTAVRVSIDGQPITDSLDGKSISIDPGAHALRFEHAREQPIERTIVVREGEKARVVSVTWAKSAAQAGRPGVAARTSSGPPASAWIFGGVGVGAVGAFVALALDGMHRRSALEQACFGSCRQEQVDAIKAQLAVADAALALGVVSLGVSTVLFLSRARSSEAPLAKERASRAPSIAIDLAPRAAGGAVGVTGRF